MTEEIKPNGVYTTEETRSILKISDSTMKRMLKKGLIQANKVGKQYRILGGEILRVVSPKTEKGVTQKYLDIKRKVVRRLKNW